MRLRFLLPALPLRAGLLFLNVLVLMLLVCPNGAAAQGSAAAPGSAAPPEERADADASLTALVGATLVQPGQDPVRDAVVVIDGETIEAVGAQGETPIPDGATVVDASGKYVMPGMVDGHVHFFQSGGLYTRPDAIDLRRVRPYTDEIRQIKDRLPDTFRRYLASGITSVVDVGGPMWNLDVRARADTTADAPTVVTAGPLISSVQPSALTTDDPPILKIETPEAAREEVRRQVEAGVDLIKIWYIVRGGGPEAFRPVVDATIDEAHAAGMRVAVHATQLETARAAVEAGADILVHSVFREPVDYAFVQLLIDNDVIYTPTLMVSERYRETFAQQLDFTVAEHRLAQKDVLASLFDLRTLPDSLLPPRMQERIEQAPTVAADSVAIRNLTRVFDAGVTVAAGTDAGNIGSPHGPALSREFELMRAAGLTPEEVLQTATTGGARLTGRDDVGRIEPGMQADLVVVNGNPLDDLQHAFDVETVVRRGHVFHRDALLPPTPEAAVQQQLNAYNAGDIDGFLDAFADSVNVLTYPGQAGARGGMQGQADLRRVYGSLFDRAPTLHAHVTQRMVKGRVVIDYEEVTGIPGRSGMTTAIAIYHVNRDGKIDRVEFVQ